MKKSITTFCVLLITIIITSSTILLVYDFNSRNQKMNRELTILQEEYENIQIKYYDLLANYSQLKVNYTNILLESPKIVPNPGVGEKIDDETYESRLIALQIEYRKLNSEYERLLSDYQKLRSITHQRLMRGNIQEFITPEDPEVVKITYNITGKTGNITDPNAHWKDIRAIYNWVNNNIEYREDGLYPILPSNLSEIRSEGIEHTNQMAQFPNETLKFRSGDCEDIAVLLTSMLRAYFDKQYRVECIWITGKTAGHVAVMIPFEGGKLAVLDPIRDYFSHNIFGQLAVNSVDIEIYNWLNIWRPALGSDIHVYRVFSDYMDKTFVTTEEYLVWMHNR